MEELFLLVANMQTLNWMLIFVGQGLTIIFSEYETFASSLSNHLAKN